MNEDEMPIDPADIFKIFEKPKKLSRKQWLQARVNLAKAGYNLIRMPGDPLLYVQLISSETYFPNVL